MPLERNVAMKLTTEPMPIRLSVLLCQHEGLWVADCPELRVRTADPARDVALANVQKLCLAHLLYGLKKGIPIRDLLHPPTEELVIALARAKRQGDADVKFTVSLRDAPTLLINTYEAADAA